MKFSKIVLFKKILKYGLVFLSAILLLCVLLFFLVHAGTFGTLPGKKELKAITIARILHLIERVKKMRILF